MTYADKLKELAAGELIAHLQYAMAAKAITGSGELHDYIQDHCAEHADQEYGHYVLLVDELRRAGEEPFTSVQATSENADPETVEMDSYTPEYLKEFFQKAEMQAIRAYILFYKEISDNPNLDELSDIIYDIISDEKEHELDFRKAGRI